MAEHGAARRTAFEEIARLVRFGLAGLANTALGGAIILVLQLGVGLDARLANAGGFAVGMALGFVLSRGFVFRSTGRRGAAGLRYAVAVAVAFGLNQFCLAALAPAMQGPGTIVLVQGAAIATYTTTLFLLSRFWVFAPARTAPG
jgi:putative flippase GtrA